MHVTILILKFGAFTAAKYGSKLVKPRGSIVFTTSIANLRPGSGWSLGASICGAMEGLTRALAVEFAPIRVNGCRNEFMDRYVSR